jgi:hypothetical protein
VQRVNFRAQLADDVAVDRDAAVEDELFARAPRSHAGVGKKFLEANGQDVESLNR